MNEDDDDRFLLLNDLPVVGLDGDLMQTSATAETLAELIRRSRPNTPFVLAIDGGWGTGKSTIMRQLSVELGRWPRETTVVWFNAWTANGVSALTAMLRRVLEAMDRNFVRRAVRQLRSSSLLPSLIRIVTMVVATFFRLDRVLDHLWERVSVDAKARDDVRKLLSSALGDWAEPVNGVPRRMIVVFVDDLDRCGNRTVIEVCEAIKLYLDMPGIAFVIGCDLEVLARTSLPGTSEAAHVRHYLEKIIQVNYRIPPPRPGSVAQMIRDMRGARGLTPFLPTGWSTSWRGTQTVTPVA